MLQWRGVNCACTPRHREKRSGGVVLCAAVMAALLPLGLLDTQQPRGLLPVPRPQFSIQLAAGKLPSTYPRLSGGCSAGGNNSPACRWPRSSCACRVFIALCRASPPHPILSSRHVYESTSCLPLSDLKWLLLLENLHFCLLEVITNLEILRNVVF